ncbi:MULTISPECIES: class I SAM-dependent methyltransferase [unclassified Lebetimonas]|uniref:class I SAM-dependent methyltransferase n=1 Tax=unclassified Lebetimonas TaxID=2648158 RepID=UPI000465B697|nr:MULTISPECIES: class I SAM-dependent methyltransferase [unclassified Lebetimonas]
MALELYSKVEELFLDKEAALILWTKFIDIFKDLGINEILDIGCGGGDFCLLAKENGINAKGIDLSKAQVKKAVKKGCECEAVDICKLDKTYHSASAVFDVVNYLKEDELKRFFECVEKKIEKYFIFDINTFYAMEDLAVGTLKAESDDKFGVLYSEFEENKLITEITLFEKKDSCYKKEQNYITQYYYSVEDLEKNTNLKPKDIIPISLYGSEEAEKLILVFEK